MILLHRASSCPRDVSLRLIAALDMFERLHDRTNATFHGKIVKDQKSTIPCRLDRPHARWHLQAALSRCSAHQLLPKSSHFIIDHREPDAEELVIMFRQASGMHADKQKYLILLMKSHFISFGRGCARSRDPVR